MPTVSAASAPAANAPTGSKRKPTQASNTRTTTRTSQPEQTPSPAETQQDPPQPSRTASSGANFFQQLLYGAVTVGGFALAAKRIAPGLYQPIANLVDKAIPQVIKEHFGPFLSLEGVVNLLKNHLR